MKKERMTYLLHADGRNRTERQGDVVRNPAREILSYIIFEQMKHLLDKHVGVTRLNLTNGGLCLLRVNSPTEDDSPRQIASNCTSVVSDSKVDSGSYPKRGSHATRRFLRSKRLRTVSLKQKRTRISPYDCVRSGTEAL